MSEFKDVAHRTVVELFDLAKEQQAEIKQLKTRLAVYKEDMQKDAEKIRSQSKCINNLVIQKSDYLHKITMAIAHLDSFDHSKAGMNKLIRSIESALDALRGEHE